MLGPQRRRQEHADEDPDRPACRRARGTHPLQGRGHDRARAPIGGRGAASAMCRKGREIFPHMTVHGQSAYGPVRQRRRRATFALDEVYGWFPVPARARAPARRHAVGRTAGDACHRPRPGQRARAAAARRAVATACSPRSSRRSAVSCRSSSQRKPIGVLLVEQNIDLMQTVAHRAYVMDKGRVVAALDPRRASRTRERVADVPGGLSE